MAPGMSHSQDEAVTLSCDSVEATALTSVTGGTDAGKMKLERLIDKRSQMFETLRQTIDRYNQTAKGIIDSIGR